MKTYKPIFTIRIQYMAGADVLKINGDLAWDTVDRLRKAVYNMDEREGLPLILDLSGLDFIDSKGMSCLQNIRFAIDGKSVVLAGVPKNILRTLERTQIRRLFKIFNDVSEAIESLPAPVLCCA